MKRRSSRIYLQDILQSIHYIQEFLNGITEDEFYSNIEKQDAVLRTIEMVWVAATEELLDLQSAVLEMIESES